MAPKLLVTGFGPFETCTENPSERLATECGFPHRTIEVSYTAAREFVEQLDGDTFEHLLLMGLHSDATGMHLEMIARNEYEPGRADVLGFAPDDTQIAPHLPSHLKSTLWPTLDLEQFFINHSALVSYNAGGYLCNFIYFEALARFPSKKIGFLHVPSDAAIPICTQQLALQALLQEIQAVA